MSDMQSQALDQKNVVAESRVSDMLPSHNKKRTIHQVDRVETTAALESDAKLPATKKRPSLLQSMPSDLRSIITKPSGETLKDYLAQRRVQKQSLEDENVEDDDDKDSDDDDEVEDGETIVTWTPETFKKPNNGLVLVTLNVREYWGQRQYKYLVRASVITPDLWDMLTCLHGRTFDACAISDVGVLSGDQTFDDESLMDRRTNEWYWEAWAFGDRTSDEDGDVKYGNDETMTAPTILVLLNNPTIATPVPRDCIIDTRYIKAHVDIYAPEKIQETCQADAMDQADWRTQLHLLCLDQPTLIPPRFAIINKP